MSGAMVEGAAPSIWRQRPFWNLFGPAIGVGLEQQIVFIALPLLVYQATASAIEMNLVRGLGLLPNLLLAFVIGAVVDQTDKKRWLVSNWRRRRSAYVPWPSLSGRTPSNRP
jgi:hypothetical protein